MTVHNFPVPFKEFKAIIQAIPKEISQAVKNHMTFNGYNTAQPLILLDGLELKDKKCNNKHIRRIFQKKNDTVPRGKFFWNSQIVDIGWRRTWLLPYKYCISNKIKEIHFKILHKIYPVNCFIAKFTDVVDLCCFCNQSVETISHLFFDCGITKTFWSALNLYFFNPANIQYSFTLKDIICYYNNNDNKKLEFLLNFVILYAKFHIHKQKFAKSCPNFKIFLSEFELNMKSLRQIENNKSIKLTALYDFFFPSSD